MTTATPAPKKSVKGWMIPVATGVAGLVIGIATSGPAPAEPQVVTTPGPTVTKEVEVQRTPHACLKALDAADDIFTYSSKALMALAENDLVTARQWTETMKSRQEPYKQAKAECRDTAK
jgi:hypothetical protein